MTHISHLRRVASRSCCRATSLVDSRASNVKVVGCGGKAITCDLGVVPAMVKKLVVWWLHPTPPTTFEIPGVSRNSNAVIGGIDLGPTSSLKVW